MKVTWEVKCSGPLPMISGEHFVISCHHPVKIKKVCSVDQFCSFLNKNMVMVSQMLLALNEYVHQGFALI